MVIKLYKPRLTIE